MRLGVKASLSALCSLELNYTGPDKRILGSLSSSGLGRLDSCPWPGFFIILNLFSWPTVLLSGLWSSPPGTAALSFDAGHMWCVLVPGLCHHCDGGMPLLGFVFILSHFPSPSSVVREVSMKALLPEVPDFSCHLLLKNNNMGTLTLDLAESRLTS